MTKNERFFFFLGGGINCRQRIENKSFHDDVQELIRDESGPDYLSFFFFFLVGGINSAVKELRRNLLMTPDYLRSRFVYRDNVKGTTL